MNKADLDAWITGNYRADRSVLSVRCEHCRDRNRREDATWDCVFGYDEEACDAADYADYVYDRWRDGWR